MANGEVFVVFGGDSKALEASIASAKASVASLQRELTSLARQQVATGASAESDLGQKMLATVGRLSAARGAVSGFQAELRSVSGGASSAASGIEAVSHAASSGVEGVGFYTREIRALFDELSSGRDRQAIGTFANLSGHFLTAHAELIPLVAGFAALAGVLAYGAYQSITFSNAMKSVELTAVVAQMQLVDAEAGNLIETIKKTAGVSNSSAAEIAQAFQRLGAGGPELAEIVSNYLPMLSREMGEDAPKAAQKLAEMFAELSTKGRAYVADTKGISAATLQSYDRYVTAGQSAKAYSIIIDSMVSRLEAAREAMARSAAATKDHGAQLEIEHGAMLAGVDASALLAGAQGALGGAVGRTTGQIAAQIGALSALRTRLADAGSAASAFSQALGDAAKFDKVGTSIRTVSAEMSGMQAALQNASSKGDTAAVDQLTAGLTRAGEEMKKLQEQSAGGILQRDALQQAESDNTHLANTFKGAQVDMLSAERDRLRQVAQDENVSSAERATAAEQVLAKEKEINAAGYADFQAAENVKVAAAGRNYTQVIAYREQEVARARELFGAGSDAERAAIEQVARAKEQAANRGAAAAAKGAKDELGATEAGIKGQIKALEDSTNAYIAHLEAEVKLKQIGEGQKAALAIAALDKEKAAVDKLYQDEAALAGLSLTKKKEIGNQELAFNDAVSLKLQDTQVKAAEKTEQSWDTTMKSINSAFDSQINGLLAGTTNWHTAFTNVLRDLSEQTIKFFVNWGLEQAENAAKGIALDNARVATHITGDAAITAADQSASSAGLVANIGNVLKSIAAFAGQVGAAVAAFLAPVLGPAAVPAGAAASAAVVAMGQGGIGAMDIGAYNVPENQLALIHKNELVMPAAQAGAFRNMLDGGGSGGSAGGGDMHFHFSPQVQAIDAAGVSGFLNNYARQFAQTVAGQFNSQPSLRPSY